MVALVSDEDYERVNQYKWSFDPDSRGGYAVRKVFVERDGQRQQRKIMMHRFILGAPVGWDVDHGNHNGLDNRRGNIRLATRSQNCANRGAKPNSGSQYKGVHWHKRDKRWHASICVSGAKKFLGSFTDEESAALAYDAAALAAWGEFAHLNFPTVVSQHIPTLSQPQPE